MEILNLDRNELSELGVQYGSPSWQWNPSMHPYLFGKKKKFYIFDLRKVIPLYQGVKEFLKSIEGEKKTILFLATKDQAQQVVKEQAIRCGMPYIVNKWKGGFLTNFGEIKKKLWELQKLNRLLHSANFKTLAKKEQERLRKRRNKLQGIYEGVVNLESPPEILFIIGLQKEKTAFKEAKSNRPPVPVIAVCNSDCNPKLVDYVLPGNDRGTKSISFFAKLVAEAILEIRKKKETENKLEKETEEQTLSNG